MSKTLAAAFALAEYLLPGGFRDGQQVVRVVDAHVLLTGHAPRIVAGWEQWPDVDKKRIGALLGARHRGEALLHHVERSVHAVFHSMQMDDPLLALYALGRSERGRAVEVVPIHDQNPAEVADRLLVSARRDRQLRTACGAGWSAPTSRGRVQLAFPDEQGVYTPPRVVTAPAVELVIDADELGWQSRDTDQFVEGPAFRERQIALLLGGTVGGGQRPRDAVVLSPGRINLLSAPPGVGKNVFGRALAVQQADLGRTTLLVVSDNGDVYGEAATLGTELQALGIEEKATPFIAPNSRYDFALRSAAKLDGLGVPLAQAPADVAFLLDHSAYGCAVRDQLDGRDAFTGGKEPCTVTASDAFGRPERALCPFVSACGKFSHVEAATMARIIVTTHACFQSGMIKVPVEVDGELRNTISVREFLLRLVSYVVIDEVDAYQSQAFGASGALELASRSSPGTVLRQIRDSLHLAPPRLAVAVRRPLTRAVFLAEQLLDLVAGEEVCTEVGQARAMARGQDPRRTRQILQDRKRWYQPHRWDRHLLENLIGVAAGSEATDEQADLLQALLPRVATRPVDRPSAVVLPERLRAVPGLLERMLTIDEGGEWQLALLKDELPALHAGFRTHLGDALAGSAPGPVWAVAPVSARTPGLGRGHGMEFFRRLEELIDTRCEKYSHRSPLFIEVSGIKVPPTESSRVAGPISVERIPAALDTAGVGTLLVALVWSTDEVRSRVKTAMADHWGLGQVADSSETEAAGGRIKVVFIQDKAGALSHGPRTSLERQRDLEEMLAPYTGDGVRIAAICETDWDPDRWYPTIAARDTAEAQDGKWPSKQALARLGVTSQYVKQAPPPVPTHTKDGKPYNEKYRAKKVASRQSGLDSSTANVLREVLTGVGANDHRLGSAFGRLPLEPWWHIGVHVRRHARRRAYGRRRASTPAPLTVTLTAMRPTGGPDASWQIWAYSPQAGHWAAHGPATTALHAVDLPWDVTPYDAVGDESPQASAAAQIVEQALVTARTQLPAQAPTVLYVDGDAAEYIWAGLTDEALGQDPPANLPRPASWLPGHSLPRAQRPLATVRVIGDLERIGRPTGAHMRTSSGTWRATDTTNSLFQLAHDDGTHLYPDFLLVNVPRTYAASPSGRFGKDETRFDSDRQNKNGYAHTATRFTVIGQSTEADCNLIGAVAAVLTNQGITSDVRQSKPTPLHLARRMDSTHPYHRRTTEKEEEGPEDTRAETTATRTDSTHGT